MRSWRYLPFGLALICGVPALGTQVHFQGLEADAPSISRVLVVKVRSIRRWEEHLPLLDGGQGPVTQVHLEATCDVERVVVGPFEPKTVVVHHQMSSATVYDAHG